ncbi:MAG: glycosyltransferase family 2 protein [Ardenticatenaceae bacterium]
MSELAVVVVSYNVRDLLARALRSLRVTLEDSRIRARVLVVENASHDGSGAMVRELFPEVELLEPGENLGYTGGNNLALRRLGFEKGRMGSAEAVWLLNPDTELLDDAPHRLLEHLRTNPQVGAVGPKLCYGDGSFQHGAFAFPGLAQVALDLLPVPARLLESRLNGRYPRALWQGRDAFPVEMLLGAALMVRGETIAEIGLLDEGYFMYAEDLDWCRLIHEAGWAIHALPSATVVHHSGQSTRQFRERSFVALWRARLRYYEKWESRRYVLAVRALVRLGLAWQSNRARRAAQNDETARRLAAYREIIQLL